MKMTRWRRAHGRVWVAAMLAAFASAVSSARDPGPARTAADADYVTFSGTVHPLARPEVDLGPSDPDMPLERMILSLKLRPGADERLEKFLAEQQDPASPAFHHWLTPEEFGERFGATGQDLSTALDWLVGNGFRIDAVARGHAWIHFSGTARQVSEAFRTEVHDYFVDGEVHHANTTDISIPRRLERLARGIVSLHDFRARSGQNPSTPNRSRVSPQFTTADGTHLLAPGDFWTIYNVAPLISAGSTGQGVTIAVAGRTDIDLNDVRQFRQTFGLPVKDPAMIHNGASPGNLGGDEELEADIDVEWAGAIAPEASVQFVVSASTAASDGVILSAGQVIDNNSADILSDSFILCEQQAGPTYSQFLGTLWAQAAAQGISVVVASGDSGAAGCDSRMSAMAVGPPAVNAECATPYNVCVGGTQFLDGNSQNAYWSFSNRGATMASAISYIPEGGWNESGSGTLDASGGGPSLVWPKPSWQVAPGVPADNARDTPDVALSSAAHDGYLIFAHSGTLLSVLGTSAATPSFGGIMALVVQKTGRRQGNPNPVLYGLAFQQYQGQTSPVFHDIAVGDNTVPGLSGFACTPGYDLVTGLGSVDAAALVNSWPLAPASSFRFTPIRPAANQPVSFADTSTGTPTSWSWDFGDPTSGSLNTSTEQNPTHAFTSAGDFTVKLSVSNPGGSAQVTASVVVRSGAECDHCPTIVPFRARK
jgi:subtilase family serine protease